MNKASDSKFVTRNWNIVNDQLNANHNVGNEIIYSAKALKSNLPDYNDAYILVRDDITIIGHNVTQVVFKNCAPFTKCIIKIDEKTRDDAEDLDLVKAMYNLLEYSSSYSDTTCSLCLYSKDEAVNFNADIANDYAFKPIKYKVDLSRNTVAD